VIVFIFFPSKIIISSETDFIKEHILVTGSKTRYEGGPVSYSKAFPCFVCGRFDPTETLKFDSRGSGKIDLQGARRHTLMYKISAGNMGSMSREVGHEGTRNRGYRRHVDRISIKSHLETA